MAESLLVLLCAGILVLCLDFELLLLLLLLPLVEWLLKSMGLKFLYFLKSKGRAGISLAQIIFYFLLN